MIKTFETYKDFNYDLYPVGKVYKIKDFIEMVGTRKITPHTGTIAEVLADGKFTSIHLRNWNMYPLIDELISIFYLSELEDFTEKIEIVWVAKK